MADTNIPDMNTNNTISKQEANRTQQAAQKAELEKSVSDYDTGDSVAFRQDILNPNLHYGLLNEAEQEFPDTVSGPAESGATDVDTNAASGDQTADLASPTSSFASSPVSQTGLSAADEPIASEAQSGIQSIDHSDDGASQATAPIDASRSNGNSIDASAVPTQSSDDNIAPPTDGGTETKPNSPVEANDSDVTTSENVALNGNVAATDLDGDAISYSLDGQPAEGTVTLNADGTYSFAPGTDFDDLAVGESRTVTFDFTADDGKGSSDTGTVTIEVTGTNDAPTAIDLSATSVDENDGGAVIGTLTSSDVDSSDTHTYTVSDSRFEVVDDGAGSMVLKLKDGQSLDHESEPSVTLTVTSDDGNGGTYSEDFSINVADLNE
ncbi:hypothetical protein FDK21_19755, partial [Cohaesibacter sp. CAU 1516]|uniref:Ig-like domain-containing protein n=1 Tax=Cohaesibacter sp. CAU 1516 TaxID=2576038 RepID=UPI001285AEBA